MCLWVCMASDRLHMSIIQHLVIVELCIVALKFSYNCQLDNSLCAWVSSACSSSKKTHCDRIHGGGAWIVELLPCKHQPPWIHLPAQSYCEWQSTCKEQRFSVWNQTWSIPKLTGNLKEIQQWKCGILTMHLRTTGNSWKSAGVGFTHAYNYWVHIYTWVLLEIEGWCNKLWTQWIPSEWTVCTISHVVLYSSFQVGFSSSTPPSGTCMRSTATAMPGLAGKKGEGGVVFA